MTKTIYFKAVGGKRDFNKLYNICDKNPHIDWKNLFGLYCDYKDFKDSYGYIQLDYVGKELRVIINKHPYQNFKINEIPTLTAKELANDLNNILNNFQKDIINFKKSQ